MVVVPEFFAQRAKYLLDIERLFNDCSFEVRLRKTRSPTTRGKYKRLSSRGDGVGDRVDLFLPDVDVEQGEVKRNRLNEAQRLRDIARRTGHDKTEVRQRFFERKRDVGIVFNNDHPASEQGVARPLGRIARCAPRSVSWRVRDRHAANRAAVCRASPASSRFS